MSSNWIGALDGLAAGGVIDFDAPAFLLNQKPRYVGNPSLENLPLEPGLLPPGVKMKDIPQYDEFTKDDKMINNPSWKKWLFWGTIAALLIGGTTALLTKGKGVKFSELFKSGNKFSFSELKNKIKFPKWAELKTKLKKPEFKKPNFDGVKNFFTSLFDKIKNIKLKK